MKKLLPILLACACAHVAHPPQAREVESAGSGFGWSPDIVANATLGVSQEMLGPFANTTGPITGFQYLTQGGSNTNTFSGPLSVTYTAGTAFLATGGASVEFACASSTCNFWSATGATSDYDCGGGTCIAQIGANNATTTIVGRSGQTTTINGATTVGNITVTGGNSIVLTPLAPQVYANAATSTFTLSTNISAANAGATPGSSMLSVYPQNALDAADWVFHVGTATNAADLFNVAYNGTLTQTASAGGSLAAGNISWTSGGTMSSGGGFSTVGATAIAASTSGASFNLASKAAINTAPTISSGFGTSPSIVASNGSLAFQINVGTGGVATTGVIGLPTATNGWVCTCEDVTTQNTTVARTRQTGLGTTTTCPIGDFTSADVAGAWVASDKLACIAVAY